MANAAESAWPQPEHLDPSVHMADLDFDNFLDIGDGSLENLDLSSFQTFDASNTVELHNLPQPPNTPAYGETNEAPPGTMAPDYYSDQYGLPVGIDQHDFLAPENNVAQVSTAFSEPMYQSTMTHQFGQSPFAMPPQNGFQQPPHGGHSVPPTPNSYEMHGDAQRMWQQQMEHRAVADQRYRVRKDDALAFTPLVSPAGTPQYQMQPEFTVNPGAYEFSPLTSPMLHAQNAGQQLQQHQHQQGYYTNPSTAPSSNATSPIDPNLDVDMLDGVSQQEFPRKTRRKVQTPRSVGTPRGVRQSPIVKAQKRKSHSLLSITAPSKELLQQAQRGQTQPLSAGTHLPPVFGNDSSEAESISPEPLSEALMGPPPRPGSALTQSPLVQGQHDGSNPSTAIPNGAATPQTFLSMRQAQGQKIPHSGGTEAEQNGQSLLDDLFLPESATSDVPSKPSLTQITTSIPLITSAENTPRVSARKTPKMGPLSTPSSTLPPSATASPLIGAFSPTTASTPAALLNGKRSDSRARSNKKRGSSVTSSASMLSPALRPRISPSIKPLLPEGSHLSSQQQALLLASKSNYQNILEGNHLPGVVYPEGLSTGLTSKRTSHKVAEQGRRNRINEALKEMQTLLPPKSKINGASGSDDSPEAGNGNGNCGADGKADDKESAEIKSNNSKAATVESACLYVRQLKSENEKVQSLAKENAMLKKRLAELEAKAGAGAKDAETKDDSPNATVTASTE